MCQHRREDASAGRSKNASWASSQGDLQLHVPFERQACSPALTGSRVLRPMLALLALFEAIAIAIHFENVDVVGQAIEQRAG
jgi:hypothetical protein